MPTEPQSTQKITLPEEVGGRTYIIAKKPLTMKILWMLDHREECKATDLIWEIVPKYTVSPAITNEVLESEETNPEEMTVLMSAIIECNSITAERLADLRKKVKKL